MDLYGVSVLLLNTGEGYVSFNIKVLPRNSTAVNYRSEFPKCIAIPEKDGALIQKAVLGREGGNYNHVWYKQPMAARKTCRNNYLA